MNILFENGRYYYADKTEEEIIKILENAENYKWHDLRKNPEDLPPIGKEVYVCYISHPNAYGKQKKRYGKDTYTCMCNNKDGSKFCTFKKGNRVIAWKEIELFEVKE